MAETIQKANLWDEMVMIEKTRQDYRTATAPDHGTLKGLGPATDVRGNTARQAKENER